MPLLKRNRAEGKKVRVPAGDNSSGDNSAGDNSPRESPVDRKASARNRRRQPVETTLQAPLSEGLFEHFDSLNVTIGIMSALIFSLTIAERMNAMPQDLPFRTYTNMMGHKPFREFVVRHLDTEDVGTYEFEPFDFSLDIGFEEPLDTRRLLLDFDGEYDFAPGQWRSMLEYTFDHFPVVKMHSYIRAHEQDVRGIIRDVVVAQRLLSWSSAMLFFSTVNSVMLTFSGAAAKYSFQMWMSVNSKLVFQMLIGISCMILGMIFFFIAQQRVVIDQGPFDWEKAIADGIPLLGFMVPATVVAAVITLLNTSEAQRAFPQWREGIDLYCSGGRDGLWRDNPGHRVVIRGVPEGCPCLVGRCGGLRFDADDIENVPDELAERGLTQEKWRIWMDKLTQTQAMYGKRWDGWRCLQVLFGLLFWPLFRCCCRSTSDPFQKAMKQWLTEFNQELEPLALFVKIFTFKEMGKDGHDKEGVSLSCLVFALNEDEAENMKAQPVLQHGSVQLDSDWACWNRPCHADRVI